MYTLKGCWECHIWGLIPQALSVRHCEIHGAVPWSDTISQVGCSDIHKTIQHVCTQVPLLHILDKTRMSSENGKQNFVHLRGNCCVWRNWFQLCIFTFTDTTEIGENSFDKRIVSATTVTDRMLNFSTSGACR